MYSTFSKSFPNQNNKQQELSYSHQNEEIQFDNKHSKTINITQVDYGYSINPYEINTICPEICANKSLITNILVITYRKSRNRI